MENLPTIHSVRETPAGLNVTWREGHSSLFHYVWLRDNCYCDECGDCYSSLRRYVPRLEFLRDRPQAFDFDGGLLRVTWTLDDHESKYDAAWLYQHRYDDEARKSRRPSVERWDSTTNIAAYTFEFADVSENASIQLKMQQSLVSRGLVIIRNGPAEPGAVLKFASLCGEVGESAYGAIFDLKPGNAVGTAGTTLMELPPHSDEAFAYAPPGIETLACIEPAEEGGDSIMVDGFSIAEQLRISDPDGFDLLASWNHHYVRTHPGTLDQRAHAPVIALDDDGELSGIRLHTRASGPLDLPEAVMERYLIAYHSLCELMMAPDNQVRLKLAAGDAIIFDNHRALHSRSAFSDAKRHLQICAVPREKFHESYRLLATRLGDTVSANTVLRAGACR